MASVYSYGPSANLEYLHYVHMLCCFYLLFKANGLVKNGSLPAVMENVYQNYTDVTSMMTVGITLTKPNVLLKVSEHK